MLRPAPLALPTLPSPVLEPTWRGSASCRRDDASDFFPPAHVEDKEQRLLRESAARRLCRACPVRQQCLDHALAGREAHGIWGGLNELERRRLLRKRAAEAQTRTA